MRRVAILFTLVKLCDAAAAVQGGGVVGSVGQCVVFKESSAEALSKVWKGWRDPWQLSCAKAV